MFADDTNLFCSVTDSNKLIRIVTTECYKIKVWFILNTFSLEKGKTKIMLFGNTISDAKSKMFHNDIETYASWLHVNMWE